MCGEGDLLGSMCGEGGLLGSMCGEGGLLGSMCGEGGLLGSMCGEGGVMGTAGFNVKHSPMDHPYMMMSSSANPSFVAAYLTTTSMALASWDGNGRP